MNFRTKQPRIKPINKFNIFEPEKILLKNNIPVYIFKSNENLLKIKLIFDAGYYLQDFPLQAFFTNKLLCEGTKNYKSKKIAEIFDFYGAKLSLSSDEDHASASIIASKKNLTRLLPVLSELIQTPSFPEYEFNTQKEIAFQNFIINNEKVATIAKKSFMDAILGSSNFYGYQTKADDFKSLDVDNLKSFHKKFYTPENCFITISGDVSHEDIVMIDSHFNNPSWSGKKATIPTLKATPSKNKKQNIVKKDALQTGIRIGKTMFNRTHKDDIGFRVLNMVLGGYFGSRLMSNIREEKGYTYGIYSGLTSLKQTGYFSVATEVGSNVCKEALFEIYKEIVQLQHHIISEKELALVKNYMLGNFLRNIDGQLNYSSLFENILIFDLGTEYLYKYLEEVQNISSEKLLSLAQLYLSTDSLYEITAG